MRPELPSQGEAHETLPEAGPRRRHRRRGAGGVGGLGRLRGNERHRHDCVLAGARAIWRRRRAGARDRPPAGRAPFAAALAAKLGVAQSKVEAALQSVRQELGSGQARPSPSAFETALAKALGVNRSHVAAALQSLRPPGPPPGGQSGQPSPQGGQPQPPLQSS
jgi:hypothetical protein